MSARRSGARRRPRHKRGRRPHAQARPRASEATAYPSPQHRALLRREIEERLRRGRCAYCGAPGSERHPLTREHAIPRSRGGRRRDPGVIVPACVACNRRRGAQPLPFFLLAAPNRIARLIDHFLDLPPDALRAVDSRVFADLLAAAWLFDPAGAWSRRLSQRMVQRRRRSARRALAALAGSLTGERARGHARTEPPRPRPADPNELRARPRPILRGLAALLATAWDVNVGEVHERLLEALARRTPLPTGEPPAARRLDEGVARWPAVTPREPRPRRRAA